MRAVNNFLFLTLVVSSVVVPLVAVCTESFAFAAKETPPPDLNETPEPKLAPPPNDAFRESTVDIVTPPAVPQSFMDKGGPTYFHAYHKGFTLQVGSILDSAPTTVSNGSTSNPQLAGIEMMWTSSAGDVYEAGADLFSDGTGDLQIARRVIFGQEALRPYYKFGLGLWVNPQDQLASLVNFNHLRLLGAAGAEYHLFGRSSIRAEVGAGIGPLVDSQIPLQASLLLGWVWSW